MEKEWSKFYSIGTLIGFVLLISLFIFAAAIANGQSLSLEEITTASSSEPMVIWTLETAVSKLYLPEVDELIEKMSGERKVVDNIASKYAKLYDNCRFSR